MAHRLSNLMAHLNSLMVRRNKNTVHRLQALPTRQAARQVTARPDTVVRLDTVARLVTALVAAEASETSYNQLRKTSLDSIPN